MIDFTTFTRVLNIDRSLLMLNRYRIESVKLWHRPITTARRCRRAGHLPMPAAWARCWCCRCSAGSMKTGTEISRRGSNVVGRAPGYGWMAAWLPG